jgi:CBS-domain-containing membrane protein
MGNTLAKDVMIKRKDMYTINPKKRIALARLRMLRQGVGALPVVDDDNNLVGIITLRDIDLAGERTNDLFAEDLMTTDVITRGENTSISEIAEAMDQTSIQRIPIISKDGKLIGLVTQSVAIRSLIAKLKSKSS